MARNTRRPNDRLHRVAKATADKMAVLLMERGRLLGEVHDLTRRLDLLAEGIRATRPDLRDLFHGDLGLLAFAAGADFPPRSEKK